MGYGLAPVAIAPVLPILLAKKYQLELESQVLNFEIPRFSNSHSNNVLVINKNFPQTKLLFIQMNISNFLQSIVL